MVQIVKGNKLVHDKDRKLERFERLAQGLQVRAQMGDVVLCGDADLPAHDNFQTLHLRADRQQGLQAYL